MLATVGTVAIHLISILNRKYLVLKETDFPAFTRQSVVPEDTLNGMNLQLCFWDVNIVCSCGNFDSAQVSGDLTCMYDDPEFDRFKAI